MGILEIAPVSKRGARTITALFGPPESGKSVSALLLAAGIEPNPRKRCMLDTEAGRGRLLLEEVRQLTGCTEAPYDYAELTPPFTPERYVDALREIEGAGYTVCVVDSTSHSWAAEGGFLDSADQAEASGKRGDQKWLQPKLRYQRFKNRLLGSRMQLILCSRAKQPLIDGPPGANGKPTRVPGPWVPIEDKMLRYEYTVRIEMTTRGAFIVHKCPGPLDGVFRVGGTVGVAMGKRLMDWLGSDAARPIEEDALRQRANDAAICGTVALKAFWDDLGKEERLLLKGAMDNYKSVAAATDLEAEQQHQAERDAATNLDDPFSSAAPPHDAKTGEIHEIALDPMHPARAAAEDLDLACADTKAGYAAFATAVTKVLSAAETEDALDLLLTIPAREGRLGWLEQKSPALYRGVMDFVAARRAQFAEAA